MSTATDVIEEMFGPPGDDDFDDEHLEPQLSAWEGLEVTQSSIEIPGAAGGLRAAMKVDPFEGHKGERVFVVLECEVDKVRFDPVDKDNRTGPQARVHILATIGATLVDEELVREALDAQAQRITAAEAAAEESKAKQEIDGQLALDDSPPAGELAPPWLGFEDETAGEIASKIEQLGDDDTDLVDAIEAWEEANGGRAEILSAIKTWRDSGE